jgi:branched-chain amino acid transport system substrate-binding protein
MPTMTQAGMYSAVRNYIRALDIAKTTDAMQIIATLQNMDLDDAYMRHGRLRPDGQVAHDMYLTRVKTPQESKYPWDYCEILSVIPAEDVFIPLSQSACPLVKT